MHAIVLMDGAEQTAEKAILIVEDDADIREAFRLILEIEGYRVYTAANGKEAEMLLQSITDDPCLILLDLMMPVMNGWEFLDRQREHQFPPFVPVVLVSAVVETSDGHRAEGFLKKPVEIDVLVSTVQRFCGCARTMARSA